MLLCKNVRSIFIDVAIFYFLRNIEKITTNYINNERFDLNSNCLLKKEISGENPERPSISVFDPMSLVRNLIESIGSTTLCSEECNRLAVFA